MGTIIAIGAGIAVSQLALLDSYSFETEVEEITGYISPKNKWKLEEFYD